MYLRSVGWPRATFAFFIFWIMRPAQVDLAFDTWIFPLLGLIFLPLATLLYGVLWTVGGLSGWAWFWVILAESLDMGHAATAAANRGSSTPRATRADRRPDLSVKGADDIVTEDDSGSVDGDA